MMNSNENPWSVSNLDAFLKYCCPECDERFYKKEPFVMHAFEKHPKAKDCIELRLDSENVSVVFKNQVEKVSSCKPLELGEVIVEDVVINANVESHYDVMEGNLPDSSSKEVIENEPKLHKCTFCSESFSSLALLMAHNRKKHIVQLSEQSNIRKKHINQLSEQSNKCNQCGVSFSWASNLDLHMKNVHGLSYPKSNVNITPSSEQVLTKDSILGAPKIFCCKFCKETFALFKSMQNHILEKHSNQTALKCEICGSKFENDERKKQHIAVVHEGVKNHVCNKCGKAFGWMSNLQEHQTLVHGDHKCGTCGKVFAKNSDRKRHEETVHEPPKFPCDQCPKVFKDERKRQVHIDAVHKGLKQFKCICGMEFGWESSRRNHWNIYTHHADSSSGIVDPIKFYATNDSHVQYPCNSCDLVFLNKNTMLDHNINDHNPKPFVCKICSAKFVQPKNLKRHMREVHNGNEKNKLELCTICKKGIRKSKLKFHIAVEHEGKKSNCDLCAKTFKYPSSLRNHKRLVHMGIKPPPIPCEICNKLIEKSNMKDHIRFVHEKQRNKICPHCEKTFPSSVPLKDHIRIVHDGIRLKCQYCVKCFTTPAALKSHVKNIHEGIRWQCQHCGKLLTSKKIRDRHIRKIHKDEKIVAKKMKYCCEFCGKAFSRLSNKKTHIKKVHGG